MYCQRRKQMWVLLHRLSKILASTLAYCLLLLSSCAAKPAYWLVNDWDYGFKEGLGDVVINGKCGFINSTGKIVIKPKFDEVIYPFNEGIAVVRSGAILPIPETGKGDILAVTGLFGRWRHIDKKGRPAYKKSGFYVTGNFSERLAPVVVKGKSTGFLSYEWKCGFVDKNGEMVIPAKYNRVGDFSEGLVAFEDPNRHFGYMNTKGEIVIEPSYDLAFAFSEGLAKVTKAKYGFVNKQGDVVIPLRYDFALYFSEGLAAVKKDEKWGFVNKSGDVVIPLQYDYASWFSDGLAHVIKDNKHGYIDRGGRLVIPFKFDHANPFSEGLAAVMVESKWGYIDKKGDFVIQPKFYLASPFTEGFAKVAVGDKLGYIDKQGKYIWEPRR